MIIEALREELIGPSPMGTEVDCSGDISFENSADSYGPWKQKDSGEEILLRDPPMVRYGVGVLYPIGTGLDTADGEKESEDDNLEIDPYLGDRSGDDQDAARLTDESSPEVEVISSGGEWRRGEADTDDLELSTANAYKPSSVGVSFMADFAAGTKLVVEASGGRYIKKKVQVAGNEYVWWLRTPVSIKAEFSAEAILMSANAKVAPTLCEANNTDGLNLQIELFSRVQGSSGTRLLTVCLVNRKPKPKEGTIDESCLFQSHFKATVIALDGKPKILPYPKSEVEKPDSEERSLALLYRKAETYAVGHGCAANWDLVGDERATRWVSAECMPIIEIPSITPVIAREDGTPIEVSMAALAGLIPGRNGFSELQEVIELYEGWIDDKRSEALSLDSNLQEAAERHITEARHCATRMRDGLAYLKHNKKAFRAFQLANHAMLLQQTRNKREPRLAQYDTKTNRLVFSTSYSAPDLDGAAVDRGKWRAFQIAFLLMSVQSAVEAESPERNLVELIWFPTGGGKTEAYLGLAAFAIFMRRLVNQNDTGVHVLMRYTLRLLTAQQFQRASGLLCAMEYLRQQNESDLGSSELSIGIWVGRDTTPNKRAEALDALRALRRGGNRQRNPFILNRCPWCGAQMGQFRGGGRYKKSLAPNVIGYEQKDNTVVFKCPDSACDFHSGLPIYIIDEDIYEKRPSLIIGTVDKFAMLAWKPEARSIFGINSEGERDSSPPGLIIQDELHLISGPLGSMVGLYEAAIEELCTDRRDKRSAGPKIVCSTATIRRYADQIKALYGRDQATLFPSPGLDVEDSFFAKYARDENGNLMPGRKYLGVHAPGLGSMQTVQVRTFSSVLQAPVKLTPEERDPWWTLLSFFNSLRELGTTLSLFQSDIFDYLKVIKNRNGLQYSDIRRLRLILELTGRLHSDQIPKAIADLEVACSNSGRQPVDVCLSSNIIEVGIDIDRLSLMTVVGQPKTTSQYIQVTGRVGRKWWERPGLIITLYGASKPRDRSHFEKFRSYHERLYAQVEPTSVTPFSPPALDRALHAAMVAYVRLSAKEGVPPYPVPEDLLAQFRKIIIDRVSKIDPNEQGNAERMFDKRVDEWRSWHSMYWNKSPDDNIPLLREAGTYASRKKTFFSWSTPLSMRNVDAECQAEITTLYIPEGGQHD